MDKTMPRHPEARAAKKIDVTNRLAELTQLVYLDAGQDTPADRQRLAEGFGNGELPPPPGVLLFGDVMLHAVDDVVHTDGERSAAIVQHAAHVVAYPVGIVSIQFPHAQQLSEVAVARLFPLFLQLPLHGIFCIIHCQIILKRGNEHCGPLPLLVSTFPNSQGRRYRSASR